MITFQRLGHYGRLGNQMFEYAALVGAATRLGVEWGIDFAKQHAANEYRVRGRFRWRSAWIREFLELPSAFQISAKAAVAQGHEYREPHYHFDPGFLAIHDGTDIFGYFQSPKYFEHCAEVVRREFTFHPAIHAAAEALLPAAAGRPRVSLHIRRADYVINRGVVDLWSRGYYQRAMGQFSSDCQFCCVSDDPAWCRRRLPRTVEHLSSGSAYVDLCLISRCDHQIIANSTFSWWGAWLNANPEKRVMCPAEWFRPPFCQNDTRDLYCAGWQCV